MAKYTAITSPNFEREFAKLSHVDQQKVLAKVSLLEEDPFYPSLRSKKLKGKSNHFECSVNMDIRIIWNYDGDKIILMLDVGHHDILNKY